MFSMSEMVLLVFVRDVCEWLLMYDDKDLVSFKEAAEALYFWFLILR